MRPTSLWPITLYQNQRFLNAFLEIVIWHREHL